MSPGSEARPSPRDFRGAGRCPCRPEHHPHIPSRGAPDGRAASCRRQCDLRRLLYVPRGDVGVGVVVVVAAPAGSLIGSGVRDRECPSGSADGDVRRNAAVPHNRRSVRPVLSPGHGQIPHRGGGVAWGAELKLQGHAVEGVGGGKFASDRGVVRGRVHRRPRRPRCRVRVAGGLPARMHVQWRTRDLERANRGKGRDRAEHSDDRPRPPYRG